MTTEQTIVAARRKDAVFQASLDFIGTLSGMKPPPIETAPPETFQPFREFTERVCAIFSEVLSPRTPAEQHPDDAAVERFAAAMKAKLAAARTKGRSGWDDPGQCTTQHLSSLLRGHITKGDPVDVGNFSMMLHQREARITQHSGHRAALQVAPPEGFYPDGISTLTPTIRVACITLDGATLTIPAGPLVNVSGVGAEDDDDTYTLTFKTMTRREFEELGEFNGF